MKFRTFRYLLSEGFKNVWSHRLMSIASSGVLMACMLMIGIVFSLSANIDNYVSEIQQNAVVMVFFKDDMSRDDALAVEIAQAAVDFVFRIHLGTDPVVVIGKLRHFAYVWRDPRILVSRVGNDEFRIFV